MLKEEQKLIEEIEIIEAKYGITATQEGFKDELIKIFTQYIKAKMPVYDDGVYQEDTIEATQKYNRNVGAKQAIQETTEALLEDLK